MHYFINFTLKYLHFLQPRTGRFGSYLRHWRRDVRRKMTSELTSIRQTMHARLTTHVRRFFLHTRQEFLHHWPVQGYKNLSWLFDADWNIRPRVTVWLHVVLPVIPRNGFFFYPHQTTMIRFFVHTIWSQAFAFNICVAVNESRSYTLTSAILKIDVVCGVAMTLTPNVLTTVTRPPIQPMHWQHVLLFVFCLSHGSDKGM